MVIFRALALAGMPQCAFKRTSLVQIQIDLDGCSSPRGEGGSRRPRQDSLPSTLPKRSSSIPGRRGSPRLLCLGWE